MIMDSIMKLAHNLNMEIVAEGIEKESQWKRLKEIRCDYAQGYLFYKPMEEADISDLL